MANASVFPFPRCPQENLVLYNYINCQENVTIDFTHVDKYGKVGETYRMNVTVSTDSERDGWCNAEDIEPFRDATMTVYIFKYRELDAVSGDVSLKTFTLINEDIKKYTPHNLHI